MDITQFLLLTLHCGTFSKTGKNKGIFLFVYKILIIDFVRTDNFISYKLK